MGVVNICCYRSLSYRRRQLLLLLGNATSANSVNYIQQVMMQKFQLCLPDTEVEAATAAPQFSVTDTNVSKNL